MTIPNVVVRKSAFGVGAAIQSNDGILAIIASASGGPFNQPGMFTNQGLLTSTYPLGPLPEYASYDIAVSGRGAVAQRGNPSIAATYGTISTSITGTSVPTAGATAPLEHYSVQIKIVNGGTVGAAGITYTYSLDGGNDISAVTAQGTSSTLTIPNSGVSFTLGAGTLLAGDSWSVFTERPLLNNSDVTTSLTALGLSRLPWEGVLIDCAYSSGTVGLVDTWLGAREAKGQFNFALLNTRFLNEPTPATEAPATYATAMTNLTANDASERLCVGADGGHCTSQITGLLLKRPTSLALGAMAMFLSPNIGTDPAYVGNGPVADFQIDVNSNPNDWDEDVYQALDSQRLVTLRSFAPGGPQGVYITNPNVLAPNGSNIVWLQLLRVLNKSCSIAWQVLNTQLSKGVRVVNNTQMDTLNIDERDAQSIESLVNGPLRRSLAGQVTAVAFVLHRDDDLTTEGAPIKADVEVQALFYIKGFNVTVALVKTISVATRGA